MVLLVRVHKEIVSNEHAFALHLEESVLHEHGLLNHNELFAVALVDHVQLVRVYIFLWNGRHEWIKAFTHLLLYFNGFILLVTGQLTDHVSITTIQIHLIFLLV